MKLIPKRKIALKEFEAGGDVISYVTDVVNYLGDSIQYKTGRLSELLIDISKNWLGKSIENLGTPTSNLGAARAYDLLAAIEFIIDGGGAVITTGQKGHLRLPFAGTIISAALAADQSGSIVIDIWKDTLANFPPADADSITASAPPTLSSAQVMLDSTLTGWTKTFSDGDFLAFNVDSVTTIQRVTLSITVRRS